MCVYVASIVKNCIWSNIIQKVLANTLLIQFGVELRQFLVCLVPNVCYIIVWAMPKVTLHKILVVVVQKKDADADGSAWPCYHWSFLVCGYILHLKLHIGVECPVGCAADVITLWNSWKNPLMSLLHIQLVRATFPRRTTQSPMCMNVTIWAWVVVRGIKGVDSFQCTHLSIRVTFKENWSKRKDPIFSTGCFIICVCVYICMCVCMYVCVYMCVCVCVCI